MKKMLLGAVCAVAAMFLVTGCGSEVKAPKDTVAAVYVDLEKTVENGVDIVEMVVDSFPSDFKVSGEEIPVEEIKKEYKAGKEEFEKQMEKIRPKWALLTSTVGKDGEGTQLVLKVDAKDSALDDFVKVFATECEDRVAGEKAYRFQDFDFIVFDKKYILASTGGKKRRQADIEMLLKLYKGEGEEEKAFRRVTELKGDAVARVLVADIGKTLERMEMKKMIQEFGEAAHDEDLADLVNGLGDVTLDVNFADDNLGACLSVGCDSSSDAKMFEQLFGTVALLARISASGTAAQTDMILRQCRGMLHMSASDVEKFGKLAKKASKVISDFGRSFEADRSGSTAKLSFSLDLEDVVEDIIKSIAD